MDKCKFCGEKVDWNNPNNHYGGHTCNTERLDQVGATKRFVKSIEEPYSPSVNTASFVPQSVKFYHVPNETQVPFKCPVCCGSGIVSKGFYTAIGSTFTSAGGTETCRSCGGSGLIWGGTYAKI